jgi:hypothetical protein
MLSSNVLALALTLLLRRVPKGSATV